MRRENSLAFSLALVLCLACSLRFIADTLILGTTLLSLAVEGPLVCACVRVCLWVGVGGGWVRVRGGSAPYPGIASEPFSSESSCARPSDSGVRTSDP
jgi:hypothetical protein